MIRAWPWDGTILDLTKLVERLVGASLADKSNREKVRPLWQCGNMLLL